MAEETEVSSLTCIETIVTIQLQDTSLDNIGLFTGCEVEQVVSSCKGRVLVEYPAALNWVVKVKTDTVVARVKALLTSVLELGNKVFVRYLCETAAFIGVKVDVIYPRVAIDALVSAEPRPAVTAKPVSPLV